jgi:hypothetical protein
MEFSAPVTFETPRGNLTMNNLGDNYFITKVSGMDGAELRTPTDHRSQRDGGIVHRFFRGHVFPVVEGYFKASTVASRNAMEDTLKGYLGSTIRTDARWRVTQSGQAERFLTVRQYQPCVIEPADGIIHNFMFGLISSRECYWMDLAETDTTINSGASANITNAGNTDMFAVFQVYAGAGTGTAFTISNATTGFEIAATGMSIAAGHYVEIITWRQTMYEDGTGANQLGFLDESGSDFFSLQPGVNSISLAGDFDHVLVKSNNAWV